ncbi:Histone deacetylase complex, SIN3 component, partial [Pseudoloma neurophilia]
MSVDKKDKKEENSYNLQTGHINREERYRPTSPNNIKNGNIRDKSPEMEHTVNGLHREKEHPVNGLHREKEHPVNGLHREKEHPVNGLHRENITRESVNNLHRDPVYREGESKEMNREYYMGMPTRDGVPPRDLPRDGVPPRDISRDLPREGLHMSSRDGTPQFHTPDRHYPPDHPYRMPQRREPARNDVPFREGQLKNELPLRNSEIRNNEIRNSEIRSDQIRSDQIRNNEIRSDQIRNSEIRSDQIYKKPEFSSTRFYSDHSKDFQKDFLVTPKKKDDINLSDAMSFLETVKNNYANELSVYDSFLEVMRDYKHGKLDAAGVVRAATSLFKNKPELLEGFNDFLPAEYKVDRNYRRRVRMDGPRHLMNHPVNESRPIESRLSDSRL